MKKQSKRNRILWGAGTIISLFICYILSRHDVLGQWHNMKDWPIILLAFGFIVVLSAAVLYYRKVMICTSAGYMAGFILAMVFNTDYAGPGDKIDTMSYNNGWIIWTISFLAVIFIGTIWELISRYKKRKRTS